MLRTMDNILIHRINERLSELKRSVQSVSVEATGAKETLRKILDGTTKNPRIDTIQKLAAALETSPEWLMGQDTESSPPQVSRPVSAPALPERQMMPNDVPVRGTAAGSHLRGAFQLAADEIDWVRRPPALMGAKDVYALYVEGDSMEPQFSPGDLIYVHPKRPARIGDPVVVQIHNSGEGMVEATIGIYARPKEGFITIRKHNPSADVSIKRETVIAIHKVLSLNELFGV